VSTRVRIKGTKNLGKYGHLSQGGRDSLPRRPQAAIRLSRLQTGSKELSCACREGYARLIQDRFERGKKGKQMRNGDIRAADAQVHLIGLGEI
jgi:hypothetical protein